MRDFVPPIHKAQNMFESIVDLIKMWLIGIAPLPLILLLWGLGKLLEKLPRSRFDNKDIDFK